MRRKASSRAGMPRRSERRGCTVRQVTTISFPGAATCGDPLHVLQKLAQLTASNPRQVP